MSQLPATSRPADIAPPPLPAARPPLWTPIALTALGAAGFAAVAADLHFHGQLARWNDPVSIALHQRNTPGGIILFSGLSYLGDIKIILAVMVAVVAWLWKTGRRRSLILWLIALAGSAILNQVFKDIFQVARPDRWTYYVFAPGAGYSFPSGHTMAVGVTAGTLTLLLLHHFPLPPRTRLLAGAAVAALTILVAFALLYMGVHTLTDVLGGLALTMAWLGVLRFFLPPRLSASVKI
ncbi:MAG TPA: phosphatase PAP2 family protein [Phycisphaerae bacterium]|nr:phosphatase PAP2 family protein [Phycisphaerae bacterium]